MFKDMTYKVGMNENSPYLHDFTLNVIYLNVYQIQYNGALV